MKKVFIIIISLSIAKNIYSQNVGINNANLSPDPSAGLDVNYTDKGVLIPRVALTGTNDVTTIPGAATSLLVYNTATVSDVTPGFYYWDGTQWVRILNTGNAGGMEWLLNGNSGTTPGTNFVGTTDAQDLVFKTNNIEYMRISATNGYVGIGTSAPSAELEVNGQVKITGGAPGAGKVLTSDATGLATWQTPSTSVLLPVSYPYGQSVASNYFPGNQPPVTIATFTAPGAGLYMISAVVTINITGGDYGDHTNFNQNSQTYFRLQGGGTTAAEEHLSEDATKQISISYLFNLNAGDVVNFQVEQQNASSFGFSGLEMKVVKF